MTEENCRECHSIFRLKGNLCCIHCYDLLKNSYDAYEVETPKCSIHGIPWFQICSTCGRGLNKKTFFFPNSKT